MSILYKANTTFFNYLPEAVVHVKVLGLLLGTNVPNDLDLIEKRKKNYKRFFFFSFWNYFNRVTR